MGDVLITPPAEEPITADELRSHLRDVADPEATLTRLIRAAREYVEEATGLALMSQVRELTLDAWPMHGDGLGWWDGPQDGALIAQARSYVELPRSPLLSIQSVTTFDTAGASTVWGAANYFVDTGNRPGRLALQLGATWPIATRASSGIVIRYTAGHATADLVPGALIMAVLQIAAHWYENRELVDYEGPTKIPMQADRILSKYRIAQL